jgi:dihydrofolate synthase/folylpolyglutamate synthase
VITNIGLDHTDLLGDTVEKIAAVKAGIIKEGCHAVCYDSGASVTQVYAAICEEKHVPLKIADFSALRSLSKGLEGQVFSCGKRENLFLPLLGVHQLHNAAVVLSVIDALLERGYSISEEAIRAGLEAVSWPGRFHIVGRDPLFIIDGGHNPQCIEALVENIKDYLAGRKIIVLAGVLADKDYADMFRPVMPFADSFVCITPDNPRKMDAHDLARYLQDAGAKAVGCDTVAEGVALARELAGKDGVILSFGSLYALGDIHRAAAAASAR